MQYFLQLWCRRVMTTINAPSHPWPTHLARQCQSPSFQTHTTWCPWCRSPWSQWCSAGCDHEASSRHPMNSFLRNNLQKKKTMNSHIQNCRERWSKAQIPLSLYSTCTHTRTHTHTHTHKAPVQSQACTTWTHILVSVHVQRHLNTCATNWCHL